MQKSKLLNYEITKLRNKNKLPQLSNSVIRKLSNSYPGYTFIEMLVSVTIFAGLMVIVLGIVATTSGSNARVSILRDKNQAVRSLIDQISSDFRFVDTDAVFNDSQIPGHVCVKAGSGCLYNGFTVSPNNLVMALNLSGQTPASDWVRKEYTIETFNQHQTLTLVESRHCQIVKDIWKCDPTQQSPKTDLLSTAYTFDNPSPTWPTAFGGQMVPDGQQASPKFTPFLTIGLTIKSADFNSLACPQLDLGSCYKVSTTLNLGSSR